MAESLSVGGSTTNSLRVAGGLLGPGRVACLARVGRDKEGREYRRLLEEEGVLALLEEENLPTGHCLVLVSPGSRSLATSLGAAAALGTNLLANTGVREVLEHASVFYLAGFSLSLGQEVVDSFLAAAEGHSLVVNLSAAFVCRRFQGMLERAMRQAKIVVGNREELAALCPGEVEESAREVVASIFTSGEQTLVVTRGAAPIMVATLGGLSYVEVPRVEAVRDTNALWAMLRYTF